MRLVTEGMSNPDIASCLFISRATVKTHLTHIFTKVDVINRAPARGPRHPGNHRNTPGRG